MLVKLPSLTPQPIVWAEEDREGQLYDREVHPLFDGRFGELLLRNLEVPRQATVLEAGCATGALTALVAARLAEGGRVLGLDGSAALVERARARVEGARAAVRAHHPSVSLPFPDGAFDLVLGNLARFEGRRPLDTAADLTRVTRPGGALVLTLPLAGSWGELLDILDEVLVRRASDEGRRALDEHRRSMPAADEVVSRLERAGMGRLETEVRQFELTFRSAREFFYAPVIEHGPLRRWKALVGRGPELQEVFREVKDAIDTYFARRAFLVTVYAGRVSGRRLRAGSA